MTNKKVKEPNPKINSAEASQIIAREIERNRMAATGEIDVVLKKYNLELQATVTIGRGFIEPRIVLIPRR